WYREFDSPPLFVNGGQELITCDGKARLTWSDVETGAAVRTLDVPDWGWGIASTVLSPDGRYLALFGAQLPARIRFVEVAAGRLVGPALEHKNTVMAAAFSADGQTLATGSTDATVRLWSVPGGAPLSNPLDLHRAAHLVAFAPGGGSLVTQDSELVRLWALP